MAAVVLCVLGATIAILCTVVSDALAANATSAAAVAAQTRAPASGRTTVRVWKLRGSDVLSARVRNARGSRRVFARTAERGSLTAAR